MTLIGFARKITSGMFEYVNCGLVNGLKLHDVEGNIYLTTSRNIMDEVDIFVYRVSSEQYEYIMDNLDDDDYVLEKKVLLDNGYNLGTKLCIKNI